MKNSQIREIYDKIELDEFSKEKMYQKIKEKAYMKKDVKRKIWNYKKITSLVAVCACAVIIFANPVVQAKMKEYVNNLASWITGNSKDDYLEEVNDTVQNNNMSLTIISTQRVDREIRVKYEITFPNNLEDKINVDEYYPGIYYSEIFEDCKIFVDNQLISNHFPSVEEILSDKYTINSEKFYWAEIKDVKIKENKLIQELIVELNEEYKNEDLNFKFEFNKFKIDNKILETDLKTKYILKGSEYFNTDISIKPIKYEAQYDKYTYKFYGYSYTKTGIKIYTKVESEDDNSPIIYFIAKDNYGTEYLMYPIFTNQKIVNGEINSDDNRLEGNNLDIAIFEIYDGPANFENKYQEYFNENIKELKVEVMIEKLGDNISENITTSKISEFIINFEEDNK